MDTDQVWIGSTPNPTAQRVGLAGRSAGRFRKGPSRVPLQPVRGYAANCGAPPRPAARLSHGYLRDRPGPGRLKDHAGGGSQSAGPPAPHRQPLLLIGHRPASITPRWRSDWRKAHF